MEYRLETPNSTAWRFLSHVVVVQERKINRLKPLLLWVISPVRRPEFAAAGEIGLGLLLPLVLYSTLPAYRRFSSGGSTLQTSLIPVRKFALGDLPLTCHPQSMTMNYMFVVFKKSNLL